MSVWDADDEGCTADYGVFGSNACGCSICKPAYRAPDPRREAEIARQRRREDENRRTSSDFNRLMIDLFNARGARP